MRKLIIGFLLLLLLFPAVMPLQAQTDLPETYRLDLTRLNHIYQSWNNCGPATLAMGLGYFGYPTDTMAAQEAPAAYLKPNRDDGNVSFWQISDYVNLYAGSDLGVKAAARRGGNFELLKQLLAADLPVIVGKGLEVPDEGWVGHFLLLIGYDETQQVFLTYDSYEGHGDLQGLQESYEHLAPLWQQFNNVFLVIYPDEREAEVQTLLGDLWDEQSAWEQAKITAETNIAADSDDLWAQFNLGEALTFLGDYEGAAAAFDTALIDNRGMPFRTLWYMQGAFQSYYQTGQFKKVLQLARFVQDITPFIEDMNYYRGLVYAAQGDTEAAIERMDLVLEFNPNFYPAAEAKEAILNGTFTAPVQTDA